MKTAGRMTALRAGITVGIATLWLVICVPPMFMSGPAAITGVHAVRDGSLFPANRVRVDRGSPAYEAGLRTGDVLGCLSLRDYHLLGMELSTPHAYAGTPISTCVRRNGRVLHITFVARMGAPIPNLYGSRAGAALRVCVMLVFFITGIVLVMLRPGLSTWLFFFYAIGSAPSFAVQVQTTVWPAWQHAIAYFLPDVGTFLAGAFLLLFSIAVPGDGLPRGWRRTAFVIATGLALLTCAYVTLGALRTSSSWSPAAVFLPDQTLTALTIVVVVARLLTMERAERARFGWAAFAIVAGIIFNDLRNGLAAANEYYTAVAADFTIVMPICLIYAISKRHVIDVRFALSRTVVYALLTALTVGVIGAVDWATSAYLHEARVAMALDAAVTIGVAFALNRVHRWMERAVDFLLFRNKYEAEHFLNRLGRTLLSATHEETVDRALVHDPCERLHLTFAVLLRDTGTAFLLSAAAGGEAETVPAFAYDHDIVRFLNTERTRLPLSDFAHHPFGQSALALPILEGRSLTGFVVYGIHRDNTNFDPDEMETLERLCEAAAQAYTYIEVSRYRAERSRTGAATA